MEGTYVSNKHYRELRDAFLLDNEGFRTAVYFDTVGIPSVATGIALLARKKKEKKEKKPGRHFGLHEENFAAINTVLHSNSDLGIFAKSALKAIDYTDEPDYHGGKKLRVHLHLHHVARDL